MLIGVFRNFEELEESLTIEELQEIIEGARDKEYRGFKFAASLKGIDLDAEMNKGKPSKLQQLKIKAAADAAGMSEDTYQLAQIGISVTLEEE